MSIKSATNIGIYSVLQEATSYFDFLCRCKQSHFYEWDNRRLNPNQWVSIVNRKLPGDSCLWMKNNWQKNGEGFSTTDENAKREIDLHTKNNKICSLFQFNICWW